MWIYFTKGSFQLLETKFIIAVGCGIIFFIYQTGYL